MFIKSSIFTASPTDSHRQVTLNVQGSTALEKTRTRSQQLQVTATTPVRPAISKIDIIKLSVIFGSIIVNQMRSYINTPPQFLGMLTLLHTEGILRPYNPESIRKSPLETVLDEGLDDSSVEQSEVSLDMDSFNLSTDTNKVTLTEELSNTCWYSTEVK